MSRFCEFCPEKDTCGLVERSKEEQCRLHGLIKRRVKDGQSLEDAWFGKGQ